MGDAVQQTPSGPWLPPEEAAAYLGIDVASLLERSAQGGPSIYGLSRRLKRFAWTELETERKRMASERAAATAAESERQSLVQPSERQARIARFEAAQRAGMHLYLVEMVGHCVKVGITSNPKKRIATHIADAKKFGYAVGRIWVSYPHREALINEKTVLSGSRADTEYSERRFETLLRTALHLPMTRAEVSRGQS